VQKDLVNSHILAHPKPQRQVKRVNVGYWGKGDYLRQRLEDFPEGCLMNFSKSSVLNPFDEKRGKFALEAEW
jgi:hypothetical protein